MALIIDGHTYKGFYKITPSDGDLTGFRLIPKPYIFLKTVDATSGSIYNIADGALSEAWAYDATCIDGDGNALATSAAIANYISQNR